MILPPDFLLHPLAMLPSAAAALRGLFTDSAIRARDGRPPSKADALGVFGAIGRASPAAGRGVAIIPIFGFIDQRPSLWTCLFGTSCDEIAAAIRQSASNSNVGTILLVIDSPGGSVFGLCELADLVRTTRQDKKVVAIADSMAASAAYWLGSQATEFLVSPGGQVGFDRCACAARRP